MVSDNSLLYILFTFGCILHSLDHDVAAGRIQQLGPPRQVQEGPAAVELDTIKPIVGNGLRGPLHVLGFVLEGGVPPVPLRPVAAGVFVAHAVIHIPVKNSKSVQFGR